MNYTGTNLQTIKDKENILLLEKKIRDGIGSVMGDRYVKSDEKKKIIYIDANNLYSQSMSQPLPFDETKFDKNVKLEEISSKPDDNDFGNFTEVDSKCPDNIKKTKNFPFAPELKKNFRDYFSDYMKTNKQDTYTQTKKN